MMTRFLSGLMSLGMCSVCLANPTIYYDLWRNTSNDVASATCIKMGLTDEDVPFHDTPTAAGEYFYWVRAVHTDERESNPVGDTVWVETCGTAGVGASVRLIYPTAASDTYPTSRVPVRLELWAFNNWECGAEWDFEILLYEDDLDGEDLIAIWPVTVEVSPSFTPSLIASAWVLEDLWQYEEYVPVFNETLELGARIRFAGETESETTAPMNVALLGSVAGPALDAFPGTTGIDLAWSAVSGNTGYSTVASAVWTFDDCNDNGIPDAQDIADCTGEPWCGDCNNNEVPDGCDIDAGTSQDVNGNGVPDECEADCNDNGIPDAQDIADCTGEPWCGDCNNNEVPDGCDIDAGTSQDVNGNGVPDECEADCNSNGIPDECDVDCSLPGCDAFGDCGQVPDINHNDIPDDCEDRTWRVRNPADHPTGRWSAAMTYDSHRRVHVLFGGRIGSTNIDETWEWNGVTWQQHAAAPGDRHPSARFTHAMAYDPSRRRIVLFGGTSGLDNPLRDTWEWDGARWHSFEISGVWPAARRSPNLAFVPNRGTVVLLGGYDARDTWEWNGQSWSHLANAQAVLIDRRAHGFAYDNLRNRGVLFGGNPNKKHDTWEFDVPNLHWALVSTTGPTGREGPAMAYDTVHKGCVLFGGHGTTYYNDTWEWDGAVWTPLTPASSPSGRYNHVMSYDQHRGVIVLFSGYGAPADTWEFGIPPAKGDRDHDGDFDLVDFAGFQACFAGEGVAGAGSECDVFDFEPDGDVDIADFTAFESAMNGPE